MKEQLGSLRFGKAPNVSSAECTQTLKVTKRTIEDFRKALKYNAQTINDQPFLRSTLGMRQNKLALSCTFKRQLNAPANARTYVVDTRLVDNF